MRYKLGIVILNYSNWSVTSNCMNSIFRYLRDIDFHIYLIDNASPNPYPYGFFSKWDKGKYTFIHADENKGYAAGNNIGVKCALEDQCKYILICNSDIVFIDDSIKKMMDYCSKDYTIGIIAPCLLDEEHRKTKPSMCIKTTLKVKYLVKTPLSKINTNTKKQYYGSNISNYSPSEVYSAHGSCFLITEDCAKIILPFDEHTFLYEEESILGYQMEQSGFKTIYYPDCKVVHMHGKSTCTIKAIPYICICESELYYLRKYMKYLRLEITPLYIYRFLGYLLRMIRYKEYRKHFGSFLKRTLKEMI